MAALLRKTEQGGPGEGNLEQHLRVELLQARKHQNKVRVSLWLADLVLVSIAVFIMVNTRPGPSDLELWLSLAAMAIGAWLGCLACWLRS